MAVLNFPANPSLNDEYSANGATWRWNGNAWVRLGDPGAQGADGAQGEVGAQGTQGAQGYQGHQGAIGAQGSQGAQGSDGAQGNQGFQGHQGDVGAQGTQGAPGAQGNQGYQGRQGADGAQGTQGADGAQGNQGYQGRQGSPGAQGNQGYQGRQGAPGAQGAQGAPAAGVNGKILQVKQTVKTDTFSTNASGNTAITGLSVSITPSATSSKILVMYSVNYDSNRSNSGGGFRIYRNASTLLANAAAAGNRYLVNADFGANANQDQSGMHRSFTYLDSPSSTSSLTYQLYIHKFDTSYYAYINRSQTDANEGDDPRMVSSITVMEVSA